MSEEIITIKGIKDGLLITLDPNEEWLAVTGELAARIDAKGDFFAGAQITANIGQRPVPKHDLSGLKALLELRELTLKVVLSESATTIKSANALDITSRTTIDEPDQELADELPISSEEIGTGGIMIKRTLRSGRTVSSQGHVVVYGDVNPGAEIIASGDIVIWGRLRGNVHAGANGDETALVCALDMTPGQLRIAGYITVSPPRDQRHKARPEIALIRDQQIVVETWKQ
jgi:septum site-determining protein MinC